MTIIALFTLANVSNAQVYKVEKPVNEVTGQTFEPKLTATHYELRWVGDGRNVRGAFNIGEGFPLSSLVSNLPKTFSDTRLVPFVTVDPSSSGAAPRSTVALLLPEYKVSSSFALQFGAVLRGYDFNSSRVISGVDPYFKVSANLDTVKNTLTKLWKR